MDTKFVKKPKIRKIQWHHGTCDCCKRRLLLVCHFGYDQHPQRSYQVCEHCLLQEAGLIFYPNKI